MDAFLQSFSRLRDSYLHVFIGIARYAMPILVFLLLLIKGMLLFKAIKTGR